MTYKLYKTLGSSVENACMKINEDGSITSFIFDETNTDYQTFKKEVLAGAELFDADGNVMTDVSAFIGTLP